MKIFRNFISEEERRELRSHAVKLRKRKELSPNRTGPHRFTTATLGTKHHTPLIQSVGSRIMALLEGVEYKIDPLLGWNLSYIERSGFVQEHTDKYRDPGIRHLRCNVVVSKGDGSGRPVIDGTAYDINETLSLSGSYRKLDAQRNGTIVDYHIYDPKSSEFTLGFSLGF